MRQPLAIIAAVLAGTFGIHWSATEAPAMREKKLRPWFRIVKSTTSHGKLSIRGYDTESVRDPITQNFHEGDVVKLVLVRRPKEKVN